MKFVAKELIRAASARASPGFTRNFMALGEWVAVSNRLIGHDLQAVPLHALCRELAAKAVG